MNLIIVHGIETEWYQKKTLTCYIPLESLFFRELENTLPRLKILLSIAAALLCRDSLPQI